MKRTQDSLCCPVLQTVPSYLESFCFLLSSFTLSLFVKSVMVLWNNPKEKKLIKFDSILFTNFCLLPTLSHLIITLVCMLELVCMHVSLLYICCNQRLFSRIHQETIMKRAVNYLFIFLSQMFTGSAGNGQKVKRWSRARAWEHHYFLSQLSFFLLFTN